MENSTIITAKCLYCLVETVALTNKQYTIIETVTPLVKSYRVVYGKNSYEISKTLATDSDIYRYVSGGNNQSLEDSYYELKNK